MSFDMNDFYEYTAAFNTLKGLTDEVEYTPELVAKMIHDQLLRIQEEVDETFEAFGAKDVVEVLDGAVDIAVCSIGLLQILQLAGVDVLGACGEVATNNLMKYMDNKEEAEATAKHYTDKGDECEAFVAAEDEDGVLYGVRRIEDGKLMKPVDHPRVDLLKFFPQHEDE